MEPSALDIAGLCRQYSSRGKGTSITALTDFSLRIPVGEVHGLLGPNGAGKTTLCKILSTVLLPTAGIAKVMDFDVVRQTARVRPLVGIVFGGERGLYTRLTARHNLRYWAAMYGRVGRAGQRHVEALLDRVGLADRADELVQSYSRGMKQRLHLARGLVGDPRVVILDEPTTGMDPVAAREFRALVNELRGEGRTILLTTHDMAEATTVCDRVSLIDGGRLLGTENPRTIGRWLSEYERVQADGVAGSVVARIRGLPGVSAVRHDATGQLEVQITAQGSVEAVLRMLLDNGVTAVRTVRPSLEDVYLHLIGGRGLRV